MLQLTPLNARHRALGARMVDFGGWEMPLHYTSQIEEHHNVRRDAGMFDVSHMRVIDLQGKDTQTLLRHLVANSVDKLTTSETALYTCMLNQDGGVVDDLLVYGRNAADNGRSYRLVVNAATGEQDVAWIRQHATGLEVEVCPRPELAIIAVQGPNARAYTGQVLPIHAATLTAVRRFAFTELAKTSFGPLLVARTGYTGEDGFEIILEAAHATALWDALLAAGAHPAGLGARDTLRLEAGLPLYGQDMDTSVTPLEAGLGWTVAFDAQREFIGRAALEAQRTAGVPRQLIGLILDDRGVLRHAQPVATPHGAGQILSGTFSPTLGRAIALARVPAGDLPPGSAGVSVQIRNKTIPVRVVRLPFVRNGQPLPGIVDHLPDANSNGR